MNMEWVSYSLNAMRMCRNRTQCGHAELMEPEKLALVWVSMEFHLIQRFSIEEIKNWRKKKMFRPKTHVRNIEQVKKKCCKRKPNDFFFQIENIVARVWQRTTSANKTNMQRKKRENNLNRFRSVPILVHDIHISFLCRQTKSLDQMRTLNGVEF